MTLSELKKITEEDLQNMNWDDNYSYCRTDKVFYPKKLLSMISLLEDARLEIGLINMQLQDGKQYDRTNIWLSRFNSTFGGEK